MPKKLERKLKKQAKKKFPGNKKRQDKYVYGTLRKTGWKPSHQKGKHGSDYGYAGASKKLKVKTSKGSRATRGTKPKGIKTTGDKYAGKVKKAWNKAKAAASKFGNF